MLKAVIIFGSRMDYWYEELYPYFLKPDYVILGDGKRLIRVEELAVLKGKIDFNTRIDLYGHGSNMDGNHEISILEQDKQTSFLFSELRKLASNSPLFINLGSCYGEAAITALNYLAEASVLITDATPNSVSILSISTRTIKSAIRGLQISPGITQFQNLANGLNVSAAQYLSIAVRIQGKVYSYSLNYNLKNALSSMDKEAEEIFNKLNEFYKIIRKAMLHAKPLLFEQQFKAESLDFVKPTRNQKKQAIKSLAEYGAYSDHHIRAKELAQVLNNEAGNELFNYVTGQEEIHPLDFIGNKEVIKAVINNYEFLYNKAKNRQLFLFISKAKNTLELAQLLLSRMDNVYAQDEKGRTMLHYAAAAENIELVKLLMKHKVDPNKCISSDGINPLITASLAGSKPIVKLVLKYNADPKHTNRFGDNSLITALKEGHIDIVGMLLKHSPDLSMRFKDADNKLISAVNDGNDKLVKLFLLYKEKIGLNLTKHAPKLIYTAINGKHKKTLKLLLNEGLSPNVLLMEEGGAPLYKAVLSNEEEMVKFLLKYKADPNAIKTKDGSTALYEAVELGNRRLVAILLKNNADPNISRFIDGMSPLMCAAENGFVEIVRLLLKYKSNPNAVRFTDGATATLMAEEMRYKDIAGLLQKAVLLTNQSGIKQNGV